jgi:hypothetical protein
MNVTQSPRGGFYVAQQGNLAVFDRDRRQAVLRLSAAIWRMPPPAYFDEWVSAPRSRPRRNTSAS